MRLTAQRVVQPTTRIRAIHAFHFAHTHVWEGRIPPEAGLGLLIDSSTALGAGGNVILTFLDVFAPDLTPPSTTFAHSPHSTSGTGRRLMSRSGAARSCLRCFPRFDRSGVPSSRTCTTSPCGFVAETRHRHLHELSLAAEQSPPTRSVVERTSMELPSSARCGTIRSTSPPGSCAGSNMATTGC